MINSHLLVPDHHFKKGICDWVTYDKSLHCDSAFLLLEGLFLPDLEENRDDVVFFIQGLAYLVKTKFVVGRVGDFWDISDL